MERHKADDASGSAGKPAIGTFRSGDGRHDGPPPKRGAYEHWTREDLMLRAKELGIRGRSRMSKASLIDALRRA